MVRLDFTPTKARPEFPLESAIQKDCWAWLNTIFPRVKGTADSDINVLKEPRLQDYSYMVPNGTQLGGSRQRRAQYMNSLKAQGFRPGVSDLVIAYPRRNRASPVQSALPWYHGAYIELKREPGAYKGPAAKRAAVRPEQIEWLERMKSVGYWVSVCYGFEDFRGQVESYLRGEAPRALDFIPE